MSSPIDHNTPVSKTFWRFAIPSVAAMLVNGIYQVVDGIFIGHYIGFAGLAGVNMSLPAVGVIMGIGLMIGMGGGSLMSMFRGESSRSTTASNKVTNALTCSVLLMLGFGLIVSGLLTFLGDTVLTIQGATGATFVYAQDYLNVFTYGAAFTIAAGALPMLVRNDDSPKIATALTVVGALTNIILDYLFIGAWGMGLHGAGIATIMSQALVAILGLGYFLSHYSNTSLQLFAIAPKVALKIVNLGSSSLFMFMYFSFVAAIHNKLFMVYGSAIHVGAFAVAGLVGTMYYLVAEGLASGLQPPVSYYYGAEYYSKAVETVKLAFKVIILLGVATVAIINLYPTVIISLFSQGNAELLNVATHGVRLHLSALFLDGFIFLTSVYFMAVGKGGKALMVSVGNMLVQLPFLILLPLWLGVDGVWLAVPVSNVVLTCIIAPILWNDLRKMQSLGTKVVPMGV